MKPRSPVDGPVVIVVGDVESGKSNLLRVLARCAGVRFEGRSAVIDSVKMEPLPPGRATYVHRRYGVQLGQTAQVG